MKIILIIAAILGASGTALGAYHAHGLEAHLIGRGVSEELPKLMGYCQTAVLYQMLHAVALLGVGAIALRDGERRIFQCVAGGMILGVALFSGGLYCRVFLLQKVFGAVVPFGGLSLILAWIALGWAVFTMKPPKAT